MRNYCASEVKTKMVKSSLILNYFVLTIKYEYFLIFLDGKKVKWSEHINITVDNEQFLRVPYFGDLKVSIINNAMFTHILLESVSLVTLLNYFIILYPNFVIL